MYKICITHLGALLMLHLTAGTDLHIHIANVRISIRYTFDDRERLTNAGWLPLFRLSHTVIVIRAVDGYRNGWLWWHIVEELLYR